MRIPPRSSSRAGPVTALAAVAVLAAGVAGVVVHEPVRAVSGPPEAPAAGVEAVVPELVEFVQRSRGLAFLRPVDVEVLEDEEFEARLGSADGEARAEIEDAEAVLQAMGLVPPDLDLVEAVDRFAAEAVLGLYDAETEELVVRGTAAGPLVRTTVVHELVHALEDQHFGLERPELGDEAAAAFRAMAEGSAVVVEDRYLASLPPSQRRAAQGAELARDGASPPHLPEAVQIAFGFPYAFGPDLVGALLDAGGRERLDAAFADPPTTTEQVLEPDRYLRGEKPRPVPEPPADRPPFDDGEIGELFLILMLQAELPDGQARQAAEGWGGDRYVAWREGDRACVRMTFVMDTAEDTAQLVEALAAWAARRPGTASAFGASLRTCG